MPAIADRTLARRQLLIGGAALSLTALGGLVLPGTALAAISGEGAIRRLLELASRNTLQRLGQPDGFWNSRVARFGVPVLFRRGVKPGGSLNTNEFRKTLQHKLNNFAEAGARGAVPMMEQAARELIVLDPAGVLRGRSTAATSLLRLKTGSGLINALIDPIEQALTAAQDPVITDAIGQLSGVTLHDVAHAVANAADNGIWYEIGAAEADIRAHPEATNDADLIDAIRGARR